MTTLPTLLLADKTAAFNFSYTPVERVRKYVKDVLPVQNGFTVLRQDTTGQLDTTINFVSFIRFDELTYPGADTERPVQKWGYVFNNRTGVLMAETLINAVGMQDGDATTFFRYDPVLPGESSADIQPLVDGWLPLAPGEDRFILPIIPDDKPEDLLCFLSPWRLTAASLTDMLANGRAKLLQNFVPARIVQDDDFGSILAVTCIDPVAWAVEAKQKYYDPAMEAYTDFVASPEFTHRRAIASILVSAMANGDPMKMASNFATLPATELNRLDLELAKIEKTFSEASAYFAATCLDGDDFQMVERSCLQGGKAGVEFFAIQTAALVKGMCVSRIGQQYALVWLNDPTRVLKAQVFSLNPLVPGSVFPELRYLWFSSFSITVDLVASFHRRNIMDGISHLASHQRIETIFGAHGVQILKTASLQATVTALSDRDGNPNSALGFAERVEVLREVRNRSVHYKGASGRALKINDAILVSTADEIVDTAQAALVTSQMSKPFTTRIAQNALAYGKSFRVGIRFALDCTNLLVATDALVNADSGNKTDSVVGLVGSSMDFATMAMETFQLEKALQGKSLAWGLTGKNFARGLGGVIGIVSGLSDAYGASQTFGNGWVRQNNGIMIGATVGLAAAGVSMFSGALAVSSCFSIGFGSLTELVLASSLAGPAGLIVAGVAAGLALLSVAILAAVSETPWQEFARYSYLGIDANIGNQLTLSWSPPVNGAMPCNEPSGRGPRAYGRELGILYSLMSNYTIGFKTPFDRTTFSQGTPASLVVIVPMADNNLVVHITVTQTWHTLDPGALPAFLTSGEILATTRAYTPLPPTDAANMIMVTGGNVAPRAAGGLRITVPLQPDQVMRSSAQGFIPFDQVRNANLSGANPIRVTQIKAKIRIVSPTNNIRPYGDTYIATLFDSGLVSDTVANPIDQGGIVTYDLKAV